MAGSAQSPTPAQPNKTSPVIWIIVGMFGFVMLTGIVVIAGWIIRCQESTRRGKHPRVNDREDDGRRESRH